MPPERTDRERLAALEHQVETLRSDFQSIDHDIKAASMAAQVRHSGTDEVYRVVMDTNEGLRVRVRSLEESREKDKELKAYISGQLKTWVVIGTAALSLLQIALKFWKP